MPIYARIDPKLEKLFREKVLERFDAKKGAVEKAIEEAIRLWLKSS